MPIDSPGTQLSIVAGQPFIKYRYEKIQKPADAIDEDMALPKTLACPYWQLKLLLVTLLGLGAIATMIWLAVLGHSRLYEEILSADENMTKQKCMQLFYYILGGEAAVLAVFAAAYKKLHHSSAQFYAILADNPLGRQLGLRVHAGRWGLLSRSIRTVSAIAYVSLIVLTLMSGNIAAGVETLMLPYQAIIAVTWLGILPGIVANNAKIEQFYTAENRLLDDVNLSLQELKKKGWTAEEIEELVEKELRVGKKIPHGMRALCNARRQDLFTSLFIRKVHDINSIIGSLLSLTRVIATLAAASSFSIPPLFFAIVIGSSILSSCVAWYTNRSRLQANQNMMLDIHHDYWAVQARLNSERVQKVECLAKDIFEGLKIKPSDPFIRESIRFHLSKALLEYYADADSNKRGSIDTEVEERLKVELIKLLDSIIRPKQAAGFLTRFINRDQHNTRYGLAHIYDSFTRTNGKTSIITSSIDGLFVLEEHIVKCIIDCKSNSQQHETSSTSAPTHIRAKKDENEPAERSSTGCIGFEAQYKMACESISQQITKIDPEHLHWLAFDLVSACYRDQKRMTGEVSKQVLAYLQKQGVFNTKGLDTEKVMSLKKYACTVKDPHGNQPLRPSITRMCRDAIMHSPPAAAIAA